MIVFNAESVLPTGMLSACLSNVYDIAHEILISEGAVRPHGGNPGDATWASSDGRSIDKTLEVLHNFPDPHNKIKIFTKKGFWDGKLEMCNACAREATGDYIWQLDSDEFYHRSDMQRVVDYLSDFPHTEAVHFYANHFWGDFDHCLDESDVHWSNEIPWMRVFKNDLGSSWVSHAPPIYQNAEGKPMTTDILDRNRTLSMGIKLYHYGYVVRSQPEFKEKYYADNTLIKQWDAWQKNKTGPTLKNQIAYPFAGDHPPIIDTLTKG